MISVFEKAGRPLPPFSDDDVIDYMVTEAVIVKWVREQNQAAEKAQKKDWMQDTSRLDEFR